MHPGYAGGYAVSMYPGMGPYSTAIPPAVAYPAPSPVLNASLASTAGFSVPSSSNSSRQTSLSEPLPRPARDRRSSASSAIPDLKLRTKPEEHILIILLIINLRSDACTSRMQRTHCASTPACLSWRADPLLVQVRQEVY